MPEPIRAISQPTWGDPDLEALERLTAALGEGGVLTHKVDRDELTIVVAPERWIDAALHLRDAEGYDFLSDVVTADWLDYGGDVAGYWGTEAFGGRDMNRSGSWGNAAVPKPLEGLVSSVHRIDGCDWMDVGCAALLERLQRELADNY